MEIRPLFGYRYDPDVVGDLVNVLSPPYDQFDAESQAAAYERSPYHFVRLIYNRDEDPYKAATRTLSEWVGSGVLRREPAAAIYPYAQTYRDPAGREQCRRGFLALLRLTELAQGPVYPHERTLPKPLGDRYKLLQATKADMGPVFVTFPDDEGRVANLLMKAEKSAPVVEAPDGDGNTHRMWAMTDGEWLYKLVAAMASADGVIADGHHRYKSALQYAHDRESTDGPDGPAAYKLVALFPASAENLTVYPIHRVVEKWTDAADVARYFEVMPQAEMSPAEFARRVQETPGTLGFWHRERGFELWRLKPEAESEWGSGVSPAYRSLPSAQVEQFVLKGLLGMSEEAIASKTGLAFAKKLNEVRRLFDRGYACALVLPSTPLEAVFETARQGEVMPQKSTYFYPKLLSGLVSYLHGR